MTQEEKRLLLKDLCARLPYGVMIQSIGEVKTLGMIDIADIDLFMPKPYLRPMSSMTEKERNEYRKVFEKEFTILEDSLDAPIAYTYPDDGTVVRDKPLFNEIDWLNANHFDYRGLIEKGLAIEAPEGMYKTE